MEHIDAVRLLAHNDPKRKRYLSRLLSSVENDAENGPDILRALLPYTGQAYRIGITGPPGAGKSTLVNAAALGLAQQGKRVGIIAVDPTSAFTGGAILGDRFRMQAISTHENIFIRSMATRGAMGGLVHTAHAAADLLDAFGYDVIIFETVGVGQSEIDIVQYTDTVVVVLVPESGDGVQAMKAGIMEIADLFVVNKSDRDQADILKRELEAAVQIRYTHAPWMPVVLKTVATQNEGIDAVLETVFKHREYLESSGDMDIRRKSRIRNALLRGVNKKLHDHLTSEGYRGLVDEQIDAVFYKKIILQDAADMIFRSMYSSAIPPGK
ncbi:MAG TPA: methylmalonyl Co-A mutase-associated GTPase MeaB [bacterium]|nr:methylmalonyl Co-A mutase-associated GTPase MeaB [bacterium]HMY36195.1 methylmalonyl Co-A mutase-associated GTPase MeaB [bacterium]HMZ05782.1 methylmalonyl Co-A mutase-associated GTPase MeaB [bacterium]HNB09058.1 methylmalonyl Co-A mutase-associated GTPase MeaB [bacterium]HNB58474.1 methylmalonyl Co-A mutase-associated GTPase MeaB [bacterium]